MTAGLWKLMISRSIVATTSSWAPASPGLMTALLLARAGRSVVVLEARQVGAVTTGNTIGKVSLLHGTKLSRDAVTYAADGAGRRQARREHAAAVPLGLPVRWEEQLPVPFPHAGGTVLPDQAQFDSMDVLAALTEQVRAHAGVVVEGRRVESVSKAGEPTVTLQDGSQVRGGPSSWPPGLPSWTAACTSRRWSRCVPTRSPSTTRALPS
jgi:glycine/D-amino acid oxidase-like deaminating enzyme